VDWGCTVVQDRDTLRAIPYEYTIFKAQVSRSFFYTQNKLTIFSRLIQAIRIALM